MTPASEFFASSDTGLRQGDIVLTGLCRIAGEQPFTPPQWDAVDAHYALLEQARPDGGALGLAAGIGLAMITSHDCQMEKEWNRRRSELIASGMDAEAASELADADHELDRAVHASPLVDIDDLDVDAGNLRAGRVVGYLPVPASADGLVPECVVDLTYRTTVDRTDLARVASITGLGRRQLQYTLIRLDSLRTSKLGFDVEQAIGQTIEGISVPRRNPLAVNLRLADGTDIELLQQPAEPLGNAAGRQRH